MKIRISAETESAIEAALDAAQGRRTKFVIDTSRLRRLVRDAEDRLEELGLPLNARSGAVVSFRVAGPTAAAYKHSAQATAVQISRGSNAWFLTGARTDVVYPRTKEFCQIKLTPEQKADAVRRFENTLSSM